MAKVSYEVCDRCRKIIEYAKFPHSKLTAIHTIKILGFGPYDYSENAHGLCLKCTREFESWMKEAPNGQ